MDPSPDGLVLSFAGVPGAPEDHLSVDGMTPRGPNLSHWPGNRTPRRWKADLSTGICLRFARAPADERRAFLGGVEAVLNDHYDTDGFLSLLAVLRPQVALAREELCLLAAATGDYQAFQTPGAFAVDRIVTGIAEPDSPVAAQFAGLGGAERSLARYRFLLEQAETVLDRPEAFAPLYHDELRAVQAEITAALDGALQRRLHPGLGLSVVRAPAGTRRITLNTLAGAYRVLHVAVTAEGPLYRYHDRTESWFELVTFQPPRRVDLRPLAERLQDEEGGRGAARWCADPPDAPVPELYFGLPSEQEYGQVSRELAPSTLPPEAVERRLLEYLTQAPPAPATTQ